MTGATAPRWRRRAILIVGAVAILILAAAIIGALLVADAVRQRNATVLAFHGETSGALPTLLDGDPVDAAAITSLDGSVLESPSSSGAPYQRFELTHPGGADVPIAWTGTASPDREVALHLWNVETEGWEESDRAPGSAPDPSELRTTAGPEHDDAGTLHALVVGIDSFSEAIDEEVDGRFPDPDSYDFAVAHITDTQYLSEGAVSAESADARARFAAAYMEMTEWIAANADERKIAYVGHTGDLIQNWIVSTDSVERARDEFVLASEAQAVLDRAGIPNGVLPGNHDNKWGIDGGRLFNEYFGPERYAQASDDWDDASYGGPWRGDDNSNHYDLFSAGGLDFVALHLGFGVTADAIAWADEVLTTYSDREAIVLTHYYLHASTRADGRAERYGDPGDARRIRPLVESHDNVVLVLGGHSSGVAWQINRSNPHRPTLELSSNYQTYEIDGERSTGFLRLLQFDVDAGEVTVNTYSPRLDVHGATDFDATATRDYAPSVDQFSLPIKLSSRTTTFSTALIAVASSSGADTGERP